jgi:uncharacterized protein
MKPSAVLAPNRAFIRALVLEHGLSNPRVFCSVFRNEDSESSDLEVLEDPAPGTCLLDIAKLQMRLESDLGVIVHLVRLKGLPLAFRDAVLAQAEAI